MRIQDAMVNQFEIVDSISTYIDNIQKLEKEWCDDEKSFLVFRGEEQEYSVPCIPTIFREFALKQMAQSQILWDKGFLT